MIAKLKTRRAHDRAVKWHVRLSSGEASEADYRRFLAWLDAAPANRAAMEVVDAFAIRLARSRAELADAVSLAELGIDEDSHAASATGSSGVRPGALRAVTAWIGDLGPAPLAAGVAVLLIAIASLTFIDRLFPETVLVATAIGEIREERLADGSAMHLDTNSRAALRYTDAQRSVDLQMGAAFFDVEPQTARPFVVTAGAWQVRALGTRFEVSLHHASTEVAVAEGSVTVRTGSGAGPDYLLREGERLVDLGEGRDPMRATIDAANVASWRERRLVFERAALSQVVERLNAYFVEEKILLLGDDAPALSFSGSLKITDAAAAARDLAALLPLERVENPDFIALTKVP